MKLKLITPDSQRAERWVELLRAEPAFTVTTLVNSLHNVNVLVNGSHPDLVLVETTTPKDFAALEKLASAHPEIDYVLIANELSPEFLMRAMRAGVREVLPDTAAPEDVLAALRRQLRKRATSGASGTPPATVPARHGRVLAIVSCKGGSGATFIATNLATSWPRAARRHPDRPEPAVRRCSAVRARSQARQQPRPMSHTTSRDWTPSCSPALVSHVSPGLRRSGRAGGSRPGLGGEARARATYRCTSPVNKYDFVVVDVGRALDARDDRSAGPRGPRLSR